MQPATTLSQTPAPLTATTGTEPATTAITPLATPVPVTPTWIPKAYGRDAVDEPQVLLLSFVKEAKYYDIPDCGMRVAFPEVAGDPLYGIRQKDPKLVMFTHEEIDTFEKTYESHPAISSGSERYIDPNSIGGASCAGVPAYPKWNFIRINATLIPRNARPGEYDIGINVRSHGTVIAQLRMNRTFALEHPVIFVRYVPLKLEEMDAFDSIELVYARRVQP